MPENTEKKWCVYVHISPNGKRYIGITCQKPEKRWKRGYGYQCNSHFFRAIQKYGWDNFVHEVIIENLSENDAKKSEIYLIDKFKTNNPNFGYNITSGGEGSLGISRFGSDNPMYQKHHSDETRKKMSNAKKDYYKRLGLDNFRPIYQFGLDCSFIKEFNSVKEACLEFGFDDSVVSKSCSRKINTAYGYIWSYKDMVNNIDDFKRDALQRLSNGKLNRSKNNSKSVNLFDLSGNCLGIYESASNLARQLGVSISRVSYACLKGTILQEKYKCSYTKGEC